MVAIRRWFLTLDRRLLNFDSFGSHTSKCVTCSWALNFRWIELKWFRQSQRKRGKNSCSISLVMKTTIPGTPGIYLFICAVICERTLIQNLLGKISFFSRFLFFNPLSFFPMPVLCWQSRGCIFHSANMSLGPIQRSQVEKGQFN